MLNVVSLSKLNDLTTAATAEAKILEKLWLARCKLITDMGIGCIAAWYKVDVVLLEMHLEDSVLEGCLGMDDDDGLSTPRQN
ncbi:hypothetical protein OIU85_004199 [Salix viminalis]|uniref:Uncharacterized protein n=1 Tax=Salix viminalis TaxID=40686 RepID=A0A9Q0PS84_SALVM|nr:hypothetical protein OIU85_004199 [Salix viminalis]